MTDNIDQTTDVESRTESFDSDASGVAKYWIAELKTAQTSQKPWEDKVREVTNKYRGKKKNKEQKFNILYSNIQTLQPALFQQLPAPIVERRFKQKGSKPRAMATIMERAISFLADETKAEHVFRAVRDDYLLASRAVPKVVYSAEVYEPSEADMQMAMATGQHQPVPRITNQKTTIDHVAWNDLLMNPEGTWEKKRWVAFRTRMNKRQLESAFGEEKAKIVMDKCKAKMAQSGGQAEATLFRQAEVWEIWDKTDRNVIWVNMEVDTTVLDTEGDPLGLKDFWPCPRPIQLIEVSSDPGPVVEYSLYEDQAAEVNRLTRRIYSLSDKIRAVGMFAGSQSELLKEIFTQNDGTLVPVEDWYSLMESGGLKSKVEWVPVLEMVQVLNQLYIARNSSKEDLYEVSGMSDIIRGQGKERETAQAQRIKGTFATMRLDERKRSFSKLIAETYGIMAEIVSEHYEPEFLAAISDHDAPMTRAEAQARADQQNAQMQQQAAMAQSQNQQPPQMQPVEPDLSWEEIMEAFRSDFVRSYTLTVDSEDTIEADRQQDKQQRIEFVTAFVQLLSALGPMVMGGGMPWEIAREIIMFSVRGFSKARTLEEVLEEFQPQMPQQGGEDNGDAVKVEIEKMKGQMAQLLLEMKQHHETEEKAKDRDLALTTVAIQAGQTEDITNLSRESKAADILADERARKSDSDEREKDRLSKQQIGGGSNVN